MLRHLSAFVLLSSLVFPQNVDSLLIQNIQNISDTTLIGTNDTTFIADSITTSMTAKVDTLFPIQGMPLSDVSTIINKRTFLFDKYRYTGDLLRSFSLNFVKDLGFVGYPNETFIYGVGNNGISYLQDGVYWNNRHTNSLDLNLVQSENIDSIEIVPSPRGFLYGPYNNPVTVNFITRDFISPQPYSRIRYYEGPDGEAMIDGKFSAMLAKRWNFSFQLTNRSKDETYVNTDLSIWQFNTKLKYYLSNSVNFQGYYYFVDRKQGLNGGVDFDSLSRSSDDPNTDLYDPIFAPVVSPNRKLDVLQHNVGLRTFAKPFDDSQLDLSLYYRYGLDEVRDFRDSLDFKEDKENKSYGAVLNYYYTYDFLTLRLLGDYESSTKETVRGNNIYIENYNYNTDRFSYGGVLTASLLDNFIRPSVYYKQNNWGDDNVSAVGMGADIEFLLGQAQSLYIGYSIRDNRYSDEENMPAFEIGTIYQSSNLMWDIKYFSNEYYNYYDISLEPLWGSAIKEVRGLGLILNYKFWLLLLETNTFYFFEVNDKPPINLPEWQFIGGLYVNDLFFDNNLDLKAGFKFSYTGKILSVEDYYYNGAVVEPTNKLDFNLAGEIKKVAIFYFQWENLFGNEYYITPYYPMPERNIKFGLAWELFN